MSSIADGLTASVLIPIGRVLTVSGDAVVSVSGANVKVIGSRQFGPYSSELTVSVSAVSGASYSLSPAAVSGASNVLLSNGELVDETGDAIPRKTALVSSLVASYESQSALDSMFGPMLLARTGYPVAADVPTLTASATAPTADADAAAQVIYPFGSAALTDPILPSRLANKIWFKGHNQSLRARSYGSSLRLASAIGNYGSNGQQDQDSTIGYGIDTAFITVDIILDGDVLFVRNQPDSSSIFDLYVNGSLVTASPGTNVTQVSRSYYQTAGYLKIKFGTVSRRRITMVYWRPQAPLTLHTRTVSTALPYTNDPITWLHMGDSFSQYAGASVITLGLTEWMRSAFGFQHDFVNASAAATSFSGPTMNMPGAVPTVGQKASIRQQYLLAAKHCNPSIISLLIGHNDSYNDQISVGSELTQLLRQMRADHPDALIFVFASNASPGLITSGSAVTVENTIIAAANSVPGVVAFPLQTWGAGAFLRGSGYQGATNGTGNTDLYTGSDGTHPSDAGHRAYGQMMARRIYEWAKLSNE